MTQPTCPEKGTDGFVEYVGPGKDVEPTSTLTHG